MKRGIKILLGVLVPIIIILTVYLILIIKQILPNPFLDTKDLVCIRDSSNPTIQDKIEEEKIFKFDNKAIITSYDEKMIYTFWLESTAKREYEYAKKVKTNKVTLDNNVLTILRTYIMKENEGYYGKTKKEIRKIYEEDLGYDCE